MPVFFWCENSAWTQSRKHIGRLLSPFRSSFRQEQRQERVDECRKDGHGGSERRSGREVVERVCQETRAGGYKTVGARTEVSVWIWRSTREDPQEEEKNTRRVLVIMAFVHEQSCDVQSRNWICSPFRRLRPAWSRVVGSSIIR